MPTYEYHCRACGRTFEIERSVAAREQQMNSHDLRCPDCASDAVEPRATTFEVETARKS